MPKAQSRMSFIVTAPGIFCFLCPQTKNYKHVVVQVGADGFWFIMLFCNDLKIKAWSVRISWSRGESVFFFTA